jgi:hypothetical protein
MQIALVVQIVRATASPSYYIYIIAFMRTEGGERKTLKLFLGR